MEIPLILGIALIGIGIACIMYAKFRETLFGLNDDELYGIAYAAIMVGVLALAVFIISVVIMAKDTYGADWIWMLSIWK